MQAGVGLNWMMSCRLLTLSRLQRLSLLSAGIIALLGMPGASAFEEQSVTLVPSHESDGGMFVDDFTGMLVVDMGTTFTIAGNGTKPAYMMLGDHVIWGEFISPISRNGDWEYFSDRFAGTRATAEGVFAIGLFTADGELTHSSEFEVRQVKDPLALADTIESRYVIPDWFGDMIYYYARGYVDKSEFDDSFRYLVDAGVITER